MSRERIGAGQRAPTDPYCDHGDRLNELWVEWVNMVLELSWTQSCAANLSNIRVARIF